MKFLNVFLVGLVSSQLRLAETSLERLAELSQDIFASAAFDQKPTRWKTMWGRKFLTNKERMSKALYRCGDFEM